MTDRTPAKRIPKSIGTEAKLLGNYTLTDAAVGLMPGAIVVLVTQVFLPESVHLGAYSVQALTLPMAALAMGVGGVFVYLTPSYCTSIEWLETMVRFQRSPSALQHEAATEYTHIERVYPDRGAIERTDGAFIGLIQVSPPPMALATDDEWAEKAAAFQDFLNTAVTFPIQIFSTTQAFPVDEYLDRYRDRRSDPDVQSNSQLAALLDNYVEWYEQDLDARQMTIRDHYVVVPVTPAEVRFDHESGLERLSGVPYLGVFIDAWFAPPIEEQRVVMFDALEERMRRVKTGLREIDGCEATVVPVDDATKVIGEFWAGQPLEYGSMAQSLRTGPFVEGGE